MPELFAGGLGLAEGVKVEGGDVDVGFGEGGVEDGELLEVRDTVEKLLVNCACLGGGGG